MFSSASALRPALAYALITNDQNYIPAHLLQSTTTPPDVEIGKYYYKEHVDAITQELQDALSLGPAAAEEWSKGLDAKGKDRMKAAEAWERWEIRDQQDRRRSASAAPMISATSPVIHTPVPVGKYTPILHVFECVRPFNA